MSNMRCIISYMNNNVPALQRGCDIIKAVSESRGISCAELGEELGIPKASLNRMLKCLLDNGFLRQNPKTKGLEIGVDLSYAVGRSEENSPLSMATRGMLAKLSEKWGATFVVYEYCDPFQVIWRVKHEPSGGIKTQASGLRTSKMNMNAQGQLFLSALPDAKIAEFFESGLAHKATQFTVMSFEPMMERVREIREQGYAAQERENHPSMKQVAVPLKIKNVPGAFSLGCFLSGDFEDVSALTDDMLFESGLFLSQE